MKCKISPARTFFFSRKALTFKPIYRISYRERDPFEVLGLRSTASYNEVKEAYVRLSKKYHPDVSREKGAEEKFKEINLAYQTLNERYFKDYDKYEHYARGEDGQRDSTPRDPRTEDEKLFERIFGRKFESDPMFYYDPRNEHLRKLYETERDKQRSSFNSESPSHSTYKSQWNHDNLSMDSSVPRKAKAASLSASELNILFGLAAFLSLFGVYLVFKEHKKDAPQSTNTEKIEEWRKKAIDTAQQKKEKAREEFLKSQETMKFYPRQFEPSAIEQLVDYTIFSDIKLYSVPYYSFYKDANDLENGKMMLLKKKIPSFIKINTLITLSLEAERCLKNTFINVNDLKRILEEKGVFEPPGIFFRFHGYIYMKIRRKPIVLETLDEKDEWISLFDLYFRYNSPLPFVHCDYYDFPVRHNRIYPERNKKDFSQWVGDVHLNHRPINKLYLTGNEKNVFFWRGTSLENQKELKYMMLWFHIYDETHYRNAK